MRADSIRKMALLGGGIVLVLGLVLTYYPVGVTQRAVVNQQQVLCQRNIGVSIGPLQSLTFQCPVVAGGWATASVTSRPSLSYQLSFAKKTAGGAAVLYSTSGTQFSADFPSLSNGTLTLQVSNAGSVTGSVSGSFSTAVQVNALYVYSQTKYVYRYYGIAGLLLGAAVLFLIVWDPWKVGSKVVSRLSGGA